MMDWSQFGSFLDFCAVYFTTQLVRCAAFSFILIGLVMLLRNIFFSERTFLRGMLWTLFLIIPFLGRLKLFYENAAARSVTGWMTAVTMSCLWFDRFYMAGVLAAVVCIFGKRIRLQKIVAEMEKISSGCNQVRGADMHITPFTAGLLRPEIVLPKAILESYSKAELKIIIQHEQTHIRLGHLWFGFLWDILRCLLWVNPFLTIFQKDFRSDMEDICDRVCIQNSGKTAQEYGLVLLKSLRLLCCSEENMLPAATYAGEKGFADIKRRMEKIAGFCPYRKKLCIGMAAFMAAVIGAALVLVHNCSYARCNQDENILVYQYDGEGTILQDYDNSLQEMISYDDSYVYVEREAFEDFLRKSNAKGEIFIVFGGFYKFPGIAGVSYSCCYEPGSEDKVVKIPYDNLINDWRITLIKNL